MYYIQCIYIYIYCMYYMRLLQKERKTLTRFPAMYMVWTLTRSFNDALIFELFSVFNFETYLFRQPHLVLHLDFTMCAFFCAESHIPLATKHKHLQHFNTKQKPSKTQMSSSGPKRFLQGNDGWLQRENHYLCEFIRQARIKTWLV